MLARGFMAVFLAIACVPAGQGAEADAGAVTGADAGVPAGPTVAPFSAHYAADWKSINVGISDLELKPDTAPGTYLYTWTMTARGVLRLAYSNDVIQKSWFSVIGDHVRPAKYHAEEGGS